MKYYAVANGRKTGIFTKWNDCSNQVNKFSNSYFKSFDTKSDAELWLSENIVEQKPATKKSSTKTKNNHKKHKSIVANCVSTYSSEYFAVAVGRVAGVYTDFDEYKEQIKDYPNARHKVFTKKENAEDFVKYPTEASYTHYQNNKYKPKRKKTKHYRIGTNCYRRG